MYVFEWRKPSMSISEMVEHLEHIKSVAGDVQVRKRHNICGEDVSYPVRIEVGEFNDEKTAEIY